MISTAYFFSHWQLLATFDLSQGISSFKQPSHLSHLEGNHTQYNKNKSPVSQLASLFHRSLQDLVDFSVCFSSHSYLHCCCPVAQNPALYQTRGDKEAYSVLEESEDDLSSSRELPLFVQ